MEPTNPNDLASVIKGIARDEAQKTSRPPSAPREDLGAKLQALENRLATLEEKVEKLAEQLATSGLSKG